MKIAIAIIVLLAAFSLARILANFEVRLDGVEQRLDHAEENIKCHEYGYLLDKDPHDETIWKTYKKECLGL